MELKPDSWLVFFSVYFLLPALIGLSLPFILNFLEIAYLKVQVRFWRWRNARMARKIEALKSEISRWQEDFSP